MVYPYVGYDLRPAFAREHRRIESEYIAKEEEPDNIVYDLLYKGKVAANVKDKLKGYFAVQGLTDADFGKDKHEKITLKRKR